MDDLMIDRHPGNTEIARRLDVYAAARLAPDPASAARLRKQLIGRLGASAGERAAPEPLVGVRRGSTRRRSRLTLSLLAASLSVVLVTGAGLAARPGGPFYPVLVWVESVALPTDPGLRLAAEVSLLERRLEDIASTAHDPVGLAAAVAAYGERLDSAVADHPTDRPADLRITLARHALVLQALVERLPESARGAIEQAIARGDQAIERLGEPGRNGNGPTAPGVTGPASPKPDKTPPGKPTADPDPSPATTADPTPKPGRTPHDRPSPRPATKPGKG
jgi:hypothetical protein